MSGCFYVYAYYYSEMLAVPCYIGKGSRKRIDSHTLIAKDELRRWIRRTHHNRAFIEEIKLAGGNLEREIVFETDIESEAFDMEKKLISLYGFRSEGGALLNMTSGGDGCTGYQHPESIKKLIGDMKRGKPGTPCSDETKQKMRLISSGKKHSPEAKAKVSAANKGKKMSPEHCARMSARMKGKPSPNKGKSPSVETREKLRAANLGKKYSEETKVKHRLNMMGNQYARQYWNNMRLAEIERALATVAGHAPQFQASEGDTR